MIRNIHPEFLVLIFSVPDPGVKKAPGRRIWIRNTVIMTISYSEYIVTMAGLRFKKKEQ
jgi:hypothetical protein